MAGLATLPVFRDVLDEESTCPQSMQLLQVLMTIAKLDSKFHKLL